MSSSLNSQLNEPQKEAVETIDGPLLILAGAGSGKTRVLTHRLAQIVAEGKAAPQQVLAVTFTNKAAKEMEDRSVRVLKELGIPVYDRLWISTFHSTCVRILRADIQHLGYQPFFNIYDTSDQLSVVKRVVEQLGLNDKIYSPKAIAALINDAKMKALGPQDLLKMPTNFLADKGALVFERYEEEMRRANALDFGDLLLKTLLLFRQHPQVLEKYKEQFRYIMVDEYQDTNRIQYLLMTELSRDSRNLCVVGDEDQSIYSWRGADIRNILDFEKDFPDAKVIKLQENYRSSKNIVGAASFVIRNNTIRKDKTLFTSRPAGDLIRVREEENEYEEARFVAKTIRTLNTEESQGYSSVAVFYRTNAQSRVLEEQMRLNSIPYRLVGGVKFYDRMEVKDLIAYMKLIMNPVDDVAAIRVVNVPARGIGKTTVDKIEAHAFSKKCSVLDAIPMIVAEKLVNSGTANKLTKYRNLIDEMRASTASLKPSEAYHRILDLTQYVQFLKDQDSAEAESRIQNLEELDNALVQFEKERGEEASLQSFLEELALVSDLEKVQGDADAVTLMTMHISKGLEFPNVFIVGMEQGLFPNIRQGVNLDPSDLEEERRLCYVGMTRAEQRLFLSYARRRKVWGLDQSHPPSQFLKEIPSEYVQFSASRGQPQFLERYSQRLADEVGEARENYQQRNTMRAQKSNDPFPDYENSSNETVRGLEKGARVRHPTFGVGTIYKTEGNGEDQKVSVLFQDNTIKKFVVKYARLEMV